MLSVTRTEHGVFAAAPAVLTAYVSVSDPGFVAVCLPTDCPVSVQLTWCDPPTAVSDLPNSVRAATKALVGCDEVPFSARVVTTAPATMSAPAEACAAVAAVAEACDCGLSPDEYERVARGIHPLSGVVSSAGAKVVRGSVSKHGGQWTVMEQTRVLTRGTLWWAVALQREADSAYSLTEAWETLQTLRAARAQQTYHAQQEQQTQQEQQLERLQAALIRGDVESVGRALRNDCDAAATTLVPQLRRLRSHAATGMLCEPAAGSVGCLHGPAVAFIAHSRDAAVDIASELAVSGTCHATIVVGSG